MAWRRAVPLRASLLRAVDACEPVVRPAACLQQPAALGAPPVHHSLAISRAALSTGVGSGPAPPPEADGHGAASDTDEADQQRGRVLLYESKPPGLVRLGAGLLSAQAVVGTGVGLAIAALDVAERLGSAAGVADALEGFLAHGNAKWAAAALVLGAGSQLASHRLLSFVVTRLELDEEAGTVEIELVGLFTRRRVVVPRAACHGAADTARTISFKVEHSEGARETQYYLLPNEWRTEDQQGLKDFLYSRWYNPHEQPPPPDVTAIAIDGFGPFRPAQFADPHHPVARQIALSPPSAADLEGTPLRIGAGGLVYADMRTRRDGQLRATAFLTDSPPGLYGERDAQGRPVGSVGEAEAARRVGTRRSAAELAAGEATNNSGNDAPVAVDDDTDDVGPPPPPPPPSSPPPRS